MATDWELYVKIKRLNNNLKEAIIVLIDVLL